MGQPNDGEIHRADPAYRRMMWRWFAVAVVGGIIALVSLQFWMAGMRGSASFHVWLQRVFAGVCLLFAALAAGSGLWLRGLAVATARDRRWPPAAMRTSQDVRVRYLTSADALVAQFRAGAWGLFAAAAALAAWAAWMLLYAK
jgi:hypothetical protein